MSLLNLRYVGHISTVTGLLTEDYQTNTSILIDLIEELELRHMGFRSVFVDEETGRMRLNTMIFYGREGEVPLPMTDLHHPIQDGGVITFW